MEKKGNLMIGHTPDNVSCSNHKYLVLVAGQETCLWRCNQAVIINNPDNQAAQELQILDPGCEPGYLVCSDCNRGGYSREELHELHHDATTINHGIKKEQQEYVHTAACTRKADA